MYFPYFRFRLQFSPLIFKVFSYLLVQYIGFLIYAFYFRCGLLQDQKFMNKMYFYLFVEQRISKKFNYIYVLPINWKFRILLSLRLFIINRESFWTVPKYMGGKTFLQMMSPCLLDKFIYLLYRFLVVHLGRED